MNKLYSSLILTTILSSCHPAEIKRPHTPIPDLLVETMCESQNGIFHYYRIFKGSSTEADSEFIDKEDNGTLDYTKRQNQWCTLVTNKTPEQLREGRITTESYCQEQYDPFGTPMKKYWESSFFSNKQFKTK